jgi:ribosome biogenesis GTPase
VSALPFHDLPPVLAALGWDRTWHDLIEAEPETRAVRRPARVTLHGRDAWRVHDGVDEHTVGVRGRLRELHSLPVAGDWVLLSGISRDDAVIEALLPRRTALVRKVAGNRTDEQVVAANVDVVLVCAPMHSLNPRRLERELTLVWESGAQPVVAVTKTDLAEDLGADLDEALAEIRAIALGVDVLAVSSYDGDGLDAVRALMPEGVTVAVIGPSGAGKSTLVNALVGHQVLATTAVREDNRGMHTTTARHLVRVPGAGLVLDTPGMRELSLWADEDALEATFVDLEDFARDCRFHDCRHDSEPGCAVLAAIESGLVEESRLASWRKLQRELAFLARKQDVRLAQEERKKWARLGREARSRTRP